MIYLYNFHDICYVKFLITRFLPKKKKKVSYYTTIMYIILKIVIGYYIFNINSQSLFVKFY